MWTKADEKKQNNGAVITPFLFPVRVVLNEECFSVFSVFFSVLTGSFGILETSGKYWRKLKNSP